jgi:preprotein translocase subunit SecA
LRAFGGHDPLVEYKNEGHKMFQRLLQEIDLNIAQMIFQASLSPSGGSPKGRQNIISNKEETGRNDLCPCGSGKKYKKCGMLNTEEHRKLMSQK